MFAWLHITRSASSWKFFQKALSPFNQAGLIAAVSDQFCADVARDRMITNPNITYFTKTPNGATNRFRTKRYTIVIYTHSSHTRVVIAVENADLKKNAVFFYNC